MFESINRLLKIARFKIRFNRFEMVCYMFFDPNSLYYIIFIIGIILNDRKYLLKYHKTALFI